MARPLPNFHIANASPPILLNYYKRKSIFHFCYPRANGGGGLLLPGSYVIVYFLFCSLKPGSFSSSGMVSLLSPHLCLPAQPLAARQLYLPIKANWGQGSSMTYFHADLRIPA